MYTATIYRGYSEGNITLTIGTQRSLPRCYNLFCAIYRGIPPWSRCNALQPLRRVIAAIQRPGEFCDDHYDSHMTWYSALVSVTYSVYKVTRFIQS